MDQIAVLIESLCSIRDYDLRLIHGKQVESYKDLPQMALGPSRSDCAERRTHDRPRFPRPGVVPRGPTGPIERVLQGSRDGVVVFGRYDQKSIGAVNALLQFQHWRWRALLVILIEHRNIIELKEVDLTILRDK